MGIPLYVLCLREKKGKESQENKKQHPRKRGLPKKTNSHLHPSKKPPIGCTRKFFDRIPQSMSRNYQKGKTSGGKRDRSKFKLRVALETKEFGSPGEKPETKKGSSPGQPSLRETP